MLTQAFNNDTDFLIDHRKFPNWQRELGNMVWYELVRMLDGDEQRAARCYIDAMAMWVGEMAFRTGDKGVEEFNRAIRRHESKFKLTLGRNSAAETEPKTDKTA
jgi:hypothetical protein